jgi:TonB family protein
MPAEIAAGSALRSNREPRHLRWVLTPIVALLIVWFLLLMMRWMIRAPAAPPAQQEVIDGVKMVNLHPEEHTEQDLAQLVKEAPPPPPAAPPSLARADMPSMSAPTISIAPTSVDVANVGVPVDFAASLGLGKSGVFGGFAGRGGTGSDAGSGNGTGYGRGEGFSGKELVVLSSARPQMPEWACKQKIKGWVEVVFTILPNGRVSDVKIVDAQPRGVYEAAAIESISHWIYNESSQAREAKQHVEMDPADCQYNWH